MLEEHLLRDLAIKNQTTIRNVLREYIQHLFLSGFYKKAGCEDFLFKGGTALKLVFGSPRFSEDLDFSGLRNSFRYEDILQEVLFDLSSENLRVILEESKSTSGGHLAVLKITLFREELTLSQEVSFRPQKLRQGELVVVTPILTPAYRIYLLSKQILVAEKITALLSRQKPRDFFDLYFILRNEELRQNLQLKSKQIETILESLKKQGKKIISQELRELLPRSFWPVVKDLPANLEKELEKIAPR